MKKIALIAALFSAATFCQAEDVLQVTPFATAANVAADEYNTFDLIFNCESFQTNSMRFYLYLPEGMELTDDFDDSDGQYAFSLDAARTTYKKMGSTKNTNHGVTYNKLGVADGYVEYAIVIASTGTTPLQGLTGRLAEVYYKTSAIADGVYPIYIRKVELNNSDEEEYLYPANTSYVKIGNPSNATVAFEGKLPSFVNQALVNEAAIKTVDLSKVTEINGDFTYVDSRNVVGTEATASVKYVGDKTGYYSVNVPFGGAVTGTGEVYELKSTTTEYAHFDKVASVEANKTYLATGAVTIAANAKVASVAEQTNQTGNYVLDDTFYHGKNLTVPATRGLFEGASLSNLRVVVDGVLTNINVAQIEAGESAYDLQGRQVQNAQNGVFVVNGKKQFVK